MERYIGLSQHWSLLRLTISAHEYLRWFDIYFSQQFAFTSSHPACCRRHRSLLLQPPKAAVVVYQSNRAHQPYAVAVYVCISFVKLRAQENAYSQLAVKTISARRSSLLIRTTVRAHVPRGLCKHRSFLRKPRVVTERTTVVFTETLCKPTHTQRIAL